MTKILWVSVGLKGVSVELRGGGSEAARSRYRTAREVVQWSPVLPLPVEFVAGGEGRPVCVERTEEEEPPGLGGSGSSGKSEEAAPPMKIAEDGRGRKVDADKEGRGRGVISKCGICACADHSSSGHVFSDGGKSNAEVLCWPWQQTECMRVFGRWALDSVTKMALTD